MIAFSKTTLIAPPSFAVTDSLFGDAKLPDPLDDLYFALLGEAGQTLGQPADHTLLPSGELPGIDRRGSKDDPAIAHLLGFGDHPGGVQQGLRWNAADVQADAPQARIALDQHRFLPQVGGAECRRVAAWTRS